MGLDTSIYQLVKVDPKKKWTHDEIEKKYPGCHLEILEPKTDPHDISLAPGFPKNYVFKCEVELIDYDKWLESKSTPERPVKWSDGWTVFHEGTSPWLKEYEIPGCNWYTSFILRSEDEKEDEDKEYSTKTVVELGIKDGEKYPFCHKEVLDCVLMSSEELGYCRKGFNDKDGGELFYKDMNAGKPRFLFRKKDVVEYAKKYFGQDFKSLIVDEFKPGEGRYVDFWY